MAKVLKVAAVVVGAAALIATGIGAAAGAGLIGTTVAGTTTVLGISAGTFATIGTIASVAAGLIGVAASLTAKQPTVSQSGNQTKFTANIDQGIPYAIGRTSSSGWIVHRQTFDFNGSKPSNAYQTFFGVWSGGGPIESIEAFQADGKTVSFAGDAATGGYSGWMWLRSQLGAAPESAALIATGFAPYPAGWSAQSKLSGYAAFAWTVKFDEKGVAYPGGTIPQPRAIVHGAKVYDPRQDSTYPGGNGACRALDETTYVGGAAAENPFLHGLTWAIGRWQNGRRVLGIGMALAAINVPAFVEAANVADANGWKVGGVAYSTDGKWDVLKKMLAAGAGEPLQLGGMLSCTVEAPRVSLATITDTDLIGRCTVPGSSRIADRINGCIPTYREENQDWQLVPAAKVSVPSYVALDRRPRTKAMTWELVQQADQVAELATYAICNSREIDGIVLPLKLRWIGYKPGDALTVASSMVGMDSQLVVVRKRHLDPSTGAVTMTLRTETTEKHAFALGKTTTPPPQPALQTVDRGALLQPGISASWSAVADDDGRRPDDNATNSADPASPLGGSTVGETLELVARHTATLGDLIETTAPIPDLTAKVDALGHAVPLVTDRVGAIEAVTVPALQGAIGRNTDAVGALTTVTVPALEGDIAAAHVDTAAARRQAADAADDLAQALVRALAEQDRTRTVMRDAGIYIDPATGVARLYATDQQATQISQVQVALNAVTAQIALRATTTYVAEQIARAQISPGQAVDLDTIFARINAAEVTIDGLTGSVALKADATTLAALTATVTTLSQQLDAATGTIRTKADSSVVGAIDTRLSSAEQAITAFGNYSSYAVDLRQARAVADDAAAASLQGLLASDAQARRQVVEQADIHFQLTTTIVAGLSTEAAQRVALAAQMAGNQAGVTSSLTALATKTDAQARQLTQFGTAIRGQATAIQQLVDTTTGAAASSARLETTVRQAAYDSDLDATAALRSLLAGDAEARTRVASLTQYQQTVTLDLVAGNAARVRLESSLLARIGAANAAISAAQQALATLDAAMTSRIEVAESRIGSVDARVGREETTRASAIDAEATARQALAAIVNDPATGLVATRAQVASFVQALTDAQTATARRVDDLDAAVGGNSGAIEEVRQVAVTARDTTTSISTTLRQASIGADADAETALRALVGGDTEAAKRVQALAQIHVETTTTRLADLGEQAEVNQSLLAKVGDAAAAISDTNRVVADQNKATTTRFAQAESAIGAADARIDREEKTRADEVSAAATAHDALAAIVNDPATGLAKTRADLAEETTALATKTDAALDDIRLLRVEVDDPQTGLPATRAQFAESVKLVDDAQQATAQALSGLTAAVNDPDTGLPRTRADLLAQGTAMAAGDKANADLIGQIQAILSDPSSGLAAAFAKIVAEEQASVARDSANAQATQEVSAGVGSLSGTVTDLQAVTVDLAGKVRARFQQIAQVADQIAGIRAIVQQDDGTTTSNLALIAQAIGLWLQVDNTTFVRALGLELRNGVPVSQFYGEVQANSITVDKLKVNTAIVPKFFSLGSRVHGAGGTSWIEVASDTIDLAADGVIKLNITATQSFTAGAAEWGFIVIIDGEQRWNGGSIDVQGVISFAARKVCAAGRRSWSVQWAGATTSTLETLTVDIDGLNNTSG